MLKEFGYHYPLVERKYWNGNLGNAGRLQECWSGRRDTRDSVHGCYMYPLHAHAGKCTYLLSVGEKMDCQGLPSKLFCVVIQVQK